MGNFEIVDYVKIALIGFVGVYAINSILSRIGLAAYKA
jgi:hypothetical protein